MNCGLVPRQPAARLAAWFAAWIENNRTGVLVLSVVVALCGGYLASRMEVEASLTGLLPPEERSVRDLAKIQKRARPFGTVQVLLESDDVALRARAGEALARRLATVRPELVAQFSADDGELQRYLWQHRYLWAKLDDLVAARDELKSRIERAKLDANPLYISLDDDLDDDTDGAPDRDRLDELESELADLERRANQPELRVSKDGRLQLFVLQTTFPPSDAKRANLLIGAVKQAIADTEHEVGRGVRYGLTGNITMAMHEHDSVLDGMAIAAVLTVLLCGIALVFYYGSRRVVFAILWALGVGVGATFATAWAIIGHLNVMTAFLFAIVIGNGINASMIFSARFLEELRAGTDARTALAIAIGGTVRGTLAAMATAAVAYTSLLVTDFRGFQQFGTIAGVGMLLTWLAAYTVLPATLYTLARNNWLRLKEPMPLGDWLARLVPLPSRYIRVLVLCGAITAVAGVISFLYIAGDPFTDDWRDLQSSTSAIRGAQAIDAKIKHGFENRSWLSGQAYLVAIAVERRDQVAPLVAKLRAADAARPPEQRWIHDVRSLDDALPPDQDAKLAVLRELHDLLGDPELQATLSDDERTRLAKLRPPRDVPRVTDSDVPMALAWPFTEKDGSRGRLIVLRGAGRFNSFDVADRLEFAEEVRALELPPGVLVAGEALVVADIIATMERDTPKIIGVALVGSILTVLLLLGARRHGAIVIACGLAGVIVMIASCALLGLSVHFLDLIALPITIGIGVDYAVNLAARDRQDGGRGPEHLVRTTGSAVLLCSYTTAVGYGSLLLSANGGIRSFGLAALVGEVACVIMALGVAPVCLAVLKNRDLRRKSAR